MTDTPATDAPASAITPDAFLAHWQGHRRLTRRVIAAFPADEFTTRSIGGMRPFSALASELLGMAVPTARGVLTGEWAKSNVGTATTQEEILNAWDADTAELNRIVPQIPAARFHDTVTAFGQWTMPVHDLFLYVVDNEVHHRGQGYVYLRALGIEPPPFYDRS